MSLPGRETGEPDGHAQSYLLSLTSLAEQIEAAVSALTRNSLDEFQEHVARQEFLCNDLRYLGRASSKPEGTATALRDSELAGAIRSALDRVAQANRSYALLLKQSADTVALLSALCRTYSEQSHPSAETPLNQQLSCEV